MITSAECRIRADLSSGAALAEHHIGMRNTLFGMARSWTALANQTDRLSAIRIASGRPQVDPPPRYLKLVPTLWP
jgi:hypothetical protein